MFSAWMAYIILARGIIALTVLGAGIILSKHPRPQHNRELILLLSTGYGIATPIIMRTVPEISAVLKPLDKAIDNFITVLFQGYLFNEDERALLSLPARLGGMGFIIPSETCRQQIKIPNKSLQLPPKKGNMVKTSLVATIKKPPKLKPTSRTTKERMTQDQLEDLKYKITSRSKLRSIQASANENGASIWLTVLPIKQNGFFLDKKAFWDATRIRYVMPLERIPTSYECGCPFDIQHAFSCPKGGFVITRHNEIRDITAELLTEICKNVTVEPALTPLTGETFPKASAITSSHARADVSARGFWIKEQTAYCDVRVFNPIAKCHLSQSLPAAHKKNENEKKRQYNQRILQVEHGPFTPLVF